MHAFKNDNNDVDISREKGYLWIINTDDGSYFNMPTEIHTADGGGNRSTTSSSAMFFS